MFEFLQSNLNLGLLCASMQCLSSLLTLSRLKTLECFGGEESGASIIMQKVWYFLPRQQFPSTKASGHRNGAKNQCSKKAHLLNIARKRTPSFFNIIN